LLLFCATEHRLQDIAYLFHATKPIDFLKESVLDIALPQVDGLYLEWVVSAFE
jgi:hypothetical protein